MASFSVVPLKPWSHRTSVSASMFANGCDADAWCWLCMYKLMWPITCTVSTLTFGVTGPKSTKSYSTIFFNEDNYSVCGPVSVLRL